MARWRVQSERLRRGRRRPGHAFSTEQIQLMRSGQPAPAPPADARAFPPTAMSALYLPLDHAPAKSGLVRDLLAAHLAAALEPFAVAPRDLQVCSLRSRARGPSNTPRCDFYFCVLRCGGSLHSWPSACQPGTKKRCNAGPPCFMVWSHMIAACGMITSVVFAARWILKGAQRKSVQVGNTIIGQDQTWLRALCTYKRAPSLDGHRHWSCQCRQELDCAVAVIRPEGC